MTLKRDGKLFLFESVIESINEIASKALEQIQEVIEDCNDTDCPEFAADLEHDFYEDELCTDDCMDAEFTLKIGDVLFEGTIRILDDDEEDDDDE